jgi:predicted enzyme related to lactoylglutathione lyase
MTSLSTSAPILIATDLRASVDFYGQCFGFTDLHYFADNDEYAVLGLAEAQVHLMAGRAANPNHLRGSHVADAFIWVSDLDAVISAGTAAGLTALRGPESYDSTPVATTEVVFADADDNWLCFATRD